MCRLLLIFAALICSVVVNARPNNATDSVENINIKANEELKEAEEELALAERLEEMGQSTRASRNLLKKVAFLAGMRVGGLVQSSGTLAASNSLRVFGKVMNTAISVSYGTIDDFGSIPIISGGLSGEGGGEEEEEEGGGEEEEEEGGEEEEEEGGEGGEEEEEDKKRTRKRRTKKTKKSKPVKTRHGGSTTISLREAENLMHNRLKANFISNHNDLVDRANVNSKYLRMSRANDINAQPTFRMSNPSD